MSNEKAHIQAEMVERSISITANGAEADVFALIVAIVKHFCEKTDLGYEALSEAIRNSIELMSRTDIKDD